MSRILDSMGRPVISDQLAAEYAELPLRPFDLKFTGPLPPIGVPTMVYIRSNDPEEILPLKASPKDDKPTGFTYELRLYERGYQNYRCGTCGKEFSDGLVDRGVTPFMTACPCDGCGKMANGIGQTDAPIGDVRNEWFSPGQLGIAYYQKFDPPMAEHCKKGGLDRRRCHIWVCSCCHAAIPREVLAAPPSGTTVDPLCEDCTTRFEGKDPRPVITRGIRSAPGPKQPPRNKPCPCGSGLKWKQCCGKP